MKSEHGANIFELSERLGVSQEKLLDFSSNINPFGASEKGKKAVIENIDMVSVYPDPNYKKLKSAIGNYLGMKEENIVLGSGATELISSYIKLLKPKKALLLSPAYSEYEKELLKIECKIEKFYYSKENNFKIAPEEIIGKEFDLIVICNPNNPTGAAFDKFEIEKILKNFKGNLMIDETYIEFTDEKKYSSISLTEKYKNIFVIRGTSKFFSTPGIRLGYGILGENPLKESFFNLSNLWNINIFATLMGEVMFLDKEYIEFVKFNMKENIQGLYEDLVQIKEIKAYGTSSNFILCEILKEGIKASFLKESLIKKGIIIRDASNFPGLNEKFFRVCALKQNENKYLVKEIIEVLRDKKRGD